MNATAGRERGGSKLSGVVALLITVAIIFSAVKIVPVYVKSYEFRDAMRTEAKLVTMTHKAPAKIQQDLLKKARSLGLPVRGKQIVVVPRGGGVRISARYQVPINLFVTETSLSFDYLADTATAF
ncbi:MAG: DUF4845 domain-containing protein [Terriglobia bacterium]